MGQLQGCPLLLLLIAFRPGGCSDSSGHSLHFLSTVIWEPDHGEPAFVTMVYLDDQLGGHYNSTTRKSISQGPWGREVEKKEPHVLDWYTTEARITEQRMKNYLMSQTHLHNPSKGLHIWQRTISCEISKDGRKRGFNQHAYNGEDYLSFDKETLTWTAAVVPAQVTKRKWDAKREDVQAVKDFLENKCIWWLEKFLNYGKESLLRREPPVVTVKCKADYDGLETLICWAHGFHPKEIDVTWRKEGEVWDQETFRGGVIPNWDGTYHTWRSVKIHPKDRDQYRCHVEHDSLPEPLDCACEELVLSKAGRIFRIFMAVLAVLLVFGMIIYFWRRQRDSQAAHRAPPSA